MAENQNSNRKNENVRRANRIIQTRSFVLMILMGVVMFVLLFFRLFDLQITRHEELQGKAVNQQTRRTVVTANRGTIYDAGGNILAISSSAETIILSPLEIDNAVNDTEDPVSWTKESLAAGLAEILGKDASAIRKRMDNVKSQYEVIQLRADEDTAAIANSGLGSNPGTVVVADELLSQLNLQPYSSNLLVNYKQGMDVTEADELIKYTMLDNLLVDGKEPGSWGVFMTRSELYTQAAQMNGMISYLAIYIGFVLVVACAAILSIQQLSNVADGSRSYRVLAQIGCDDRQIRHSVMAQQAVFFLFPLAVGLAHSFVALKVIIELVSTFGNMSIGGTVGLTCAIFLAAYGGYFLVTYLMSAGMVQAAIATRYSE